MLARCIVFTLLLLSHAAAADELSGREIAQRSEDRPSFKSDETTALEMKLINKRGQVRAREFVRYVKRFDDTKRTLMKFWRPRDIENTGTLNIEVKDESDIQYLYLPALKKLRRISTHKKDQAWVGSDFSFEDLEEIDLNEYTFTRLPSLSFDNRNCYRYEMVPNDRDDSVYSKQIRWVTQDRFLPVKIEYFDNKGKLLKVFEATDIRAQTPDVHYAWSIVMRNVNDGHRTKLSRRWLILDSEVPESFLDTEKLEQRIQSYQHPPELWDKWRKSIAEGAD